MDGAIVGIARGQGALDLGLGETLDALFTGGRLLKAGYATERDYARERLGLPPRTMYDALELGRACKGRPFLRKAVAAGLVSPCAARAIAPVVAENEPGWTALAMTSTVRELRAAVRAAGKEPPEEFEGESLRLRMTPAQQDKLGRALALAAETLGGGAPRWQCYEAISQEWLSEHGGWAPEEEGVRGPEPPAEAKPLPECVAEHLRAIAEAQALHRDEAAETTDPKELDARALRFVTARRGYDLALGPLAVRVVNERVWAAVGCKSLEEYCVERLGMAPCVFRQRVWLERRMFALPALREALRSGRLTYSKALLVAQGAVPETIADLIAKAADTTWQQTEREATAREDQRNRAKGLRRLWAPKDVMRTVVAAILSARAWSKAEGRPIDAGEALAIIADHFVEEWSKLRGKPRAKVRQEVLGRNRGLCQVPGCSLPGRHVHHIRYRSRGGTDDPSNEALLCIPHHLRGIHMGYLKVEGRAGERLIWRFGNGEIWETEGDENVRRGDAFVSEPDPPRYRGARTEAA
ncbi:MAG: HNH endonuclease [Planctomycetota bacterium]